MTNEEALLMGEEYLKGKKIDYVSPGVVGRDQKDRIEVIFLNPIALDPAAVIDPPDIKLWIYFETKNMELIYLM